MTSRTLDVIDRIHSAALPEEPTSGYRFRRFPPGSLESDVAAWLHSRICRTCETRFRVDLDRLGADYEATGWESEAVALINFIKERL